MALNKNTKEFEVTEQEQISFDDLEFEGEAVDEDELNANTQYYTISGKVQQYEPDWERFTVNELDVGTTMEGMPEVSIFEKDGKSYNAMRLRLLDDGEILGIEATQDLLHAMQALVSV